MADLILDPIVEAVRQKLLQRSQAGIAKYGTMLTRPDLNTLEWLQHAQEEALDFANYLEVLIQREKTKLDSDAQRREALRQRLDEDKGHPEYVQCR